MSAAVGPGAAREPAAVDAPAGDGRTTRLVVVTTPRLAPGYRLAGADAYAAATPAEAAATVARLVEEGERGVVAVSASWFRKWPLPVRARFEASLRPVVLPIPDGVHATRAEEGRARFAELLERAVGVHLVFEGGPS